MAAHSRLMSAATLPRPATRLPQHVRPVTPGWWRPLPHQLWTGTDFLSSPVATAYWWGARLADLRPGTRVLVEGPYGRLTGDVRRRRRVTMLASSVGITPMRALMEELDYGPGEATLVYRSRDARSALFRDELGELATERGVSVCFVPGPRRGDGSWLPAAAGDLDDRAALLQLVPDIADHDVYLCGPQAWADAARAAVLAAGTPARRTHTERFSW